jgi:hypothetical protein
MSDMRRGFLGKLARLFATPVVISEVDGGEKEIECLVDDMGTWSKPLNLNKPIGLKPQRYIVCENYYHFCDAAASRGMVVEFDDIEHVPGCGACMVRPGFVHGRAAGVLLNEVVDIDLSKSHFNWYKDEVQIGGKVWLLTAGEIVTNPIITKPVKLGDEVYYDETGRLTTENSNKTRGPVGKIISHVDIDEYYKISIKV